jgi:hypothetical protein
MKNIKVGDLIKSYDFSKELRPDCYMIGLVKNINGPMIECKIVKQFFAGEVIERPEALKDALFHTPMQGKGMFDDRDTRIELIVTAEELELLEEVDSFGEIV